MSSPANVFFKHCVASRSIFAAQLSTAMQPFGWRVTASYCNAWEPSSCTNALWIAKKLHAGDLSVTNRLTLFRIILRRCLCNKPMIHHYFPSAMASHWGIHFWRNPHVESCWDMFTWDVNLDLKPMSSISWGEEFPFASYFRVHQGTRVLTYSQLSIIFFNMLQGISGWRNSRPQTPDRKLSKGITPSNQRRYTNSSIVLYEHQFGDVNPAICGCTQLLLTSKLYPCCNTSKWNSGLGIWCSASDYQLFYIVGFAADPA